MRLTRFAAAAAVIAGLLVPSVTAAASPEMPACQTDGPSMCGDFYINPDGGTATTAVSALNVIAFVSDGAAAAFVHQWDLTHVDPDLVVSNLPGTATYEPGAWRTRANITAGDEICTLGTFTYGDLDPATQLVVPEGTVGYLLKFNRNNTWQMVYTVTAGGSTVEVDAGGSGTFHTTWFRLFQLAWTLQTGFVY